MASQDLPNLSPSRKKFFFGAGLVAAVCVGLGALMTTCATGRSVDPGAEPPVAAKPAPGMDPLAAATDATNANGEQAENPHSPYARAKRLADWRRARRDRKAMAALAKEEARAKRQRMARRRAAMARRATRRRNQARKQRAAEIARNGQLTPDQAVAGTGGVRINMEYPKTRSARGIALPLQTPVIPAIVPPLEKMFYPEPPSPMPYDKSGRRIVE